MKSVPRVKIIAHCAIAVASMIAVATSVAEPASTHLELEMAVAKDLLYGTARKPGYKWGQNAEEASAYQSMWRAQSARDAGTIDAPAGDLAVVTLNDRSQGEEAPSVKAVGSIYKWGTRSSSDQSIYKWGTRSSSDQTIYKWGTRSSSDQSIYKWGTRSSSDQSIYKWGTRSSSDQSIYKWGTRSSSDQSIYKWGTRSSSDQSIYKWGTRSNSEQSIYKWGTR
jgi:hypothetical protein